MGDAATPSSEGTDSLSELRPRPLNFSRPRPVTVNSKEKLYHDRTGTARSVRSIDAFHEPNRDLPAEPRFSIDSDQTDSTQSQNSAASEFAWDGQLGELRSKRRPNEYEANQRYSMSKSSSNNSSRSTGRSGSTAVGSDRPLLAEMEGSQPPPIPTKLPKIVKRISFDQESERMSMSSRGDFEDGASHHTVSVDGDAGYVPEGKWSSSDYDISGLSASEIRKLRKKGINPALYAEMKAARKGKGKWVGPLVGNTFIG
jgi:hypothetical protein